MKRTLLAVGAAVRRGETIDGAGRAAGAQVVAAIRRAARGLGCDPPRALRLVVEVSPVWAGGEADGTNPRWAPHDAGRITPCLSWLRA